MKSNAYKIFKAILEFLVVGGLIIINLVLFVYYNFAKAMGGANNDFGSKVAGFIFYSFFGLSILGIIVKILSKNNRKLNIVSTILMLLPLSYIVLMLIIIRLFYSFALN